MKKFLFFAVGLIVMASCSNNDYFGDNPEQALVNGPNETNAIVFNSTNPKMTRADKGGADAADLLGNKFIVLGVKGDGTGTGQTPVFSSYTVDWTNNTAGTTESNTSDWEYVGKTNLWPSVVANQTIKYWDYATTAYDFAAYSVGKGITPIVSGDPTAAEVLVSSIDYANAGTVAYTLKGASAALAKCYITDMTTVAKANYGQEVSLHFRALSAKVRVAFYETIPGYSVKDVFFYQNDTDPITTDVSANTSATLFGTSAFYTGGTYTITFPTIGSSNSGNPDYNKAHVAISGSTAGNIQGFGNLNYGNGEGALSETSGFLARTSTAPTFAGTASPDNYYTVMLPNESSDKTLELRVNYTLVSNDGSNEEITIHGAKAFVPSTYSNWLPNYAYTYIFKISDNTNGWTSTSEDDPAGLYPITFDAVVLDSELADHTQSTITTVATPSITSYQQNHSYADDDTYDATKGNIYVQVMKSDATLANDLDTKGKLYVMGADKTEADVIDALNIQVSATGDLLVITGRNGLTLTDATSSASVNATITTIPRVDGNNITVTTKTAAMFTPTASTKYVYVYDTGVDYADTEIHTAVELDAEPTGWPTGYYTDKDCTVAATTYSDGTYYQKYTNLNKVYGVKVIKIE